MVVFAQHYEYTKEKKLHLTMAKIVKFLLYKLYFNKRNHHISVPPALHPLILSHTGSSSLSTQCLCYILLPCFLPWCLSVPPSQKKSYPSFRICSKFVMILISHSNCHNSSKFYSVEVGSYWEALSYSV